MAMPTKAASKWSRLQAAKTKVTRATRRTGDGGGEEGTERAGRTENICRSTSCSTSALCSCSFYMATCLELAVCFERKQTLRGLVRFWLSSIAGEHARSHRLPHRPYPPSLLRPTFLPSVLALSPLIIWAGPLFYGRETFGWWVWAWLARWLHSAAEGRTDCACIRAAVATPLVLNRDRRGRRHLPTLHVVPHCRLNICKPLKP